MTSGLGSGATVHVSGCEAAELSPEANAAYRQAYRNDRHELSRVVTAWPLLAMPIRMAILALIDGARAGKE